MGYLHIDNLYKNQKVLMFKEVYALEKVHGTSAHVSFKEGRLHFFAGGEKHEKFVSLFDQPALLAAFQSLDKAYPVTVFGEAYGGKQQGMSKLYGPNLCFIAFDVKVGDYWLSVPVAAQVVESLGLEFVPYEKVPADVEVLNKHRDMPSRVAYRRMVDTGAPGEGIVIRPLEEMRGNDGERIMAKHKTLAFSERASGRDTEVDPAKQLALDTAKAIAAEWVTPMRLQHVLDKLPDAVDMSAVPRVIAAMVEDVTREGAGEAVFDNAAIKAISTATVALYKRKLQP